MLTLLQLLLPEVASQHRVAVLVNAIGEVLAGHANHSTFPVLQVALVDKTPLLHRPCRQYICTSSERVNTATLSLEENLLQHASIGSC